MRYRLDVAGKLRLGIRHVTKSGVPGGTRTHNLLIRSQTCGQFAVILVHIFVNQVPKENRLLLELVKESQNRCSNRITR